PEMTAQALLGRSDAETEGYIQKAQALMQRMGELQGRINQANNALSMLAPYGALTVPLKDVRNTRHAVMLLGMITERTYDDLWEKAQGLFTVEKLTLEKENLGIFVAGLAEDETEIRQALQQVGFMQANLPYDGLVKEEARMLEESVRALEQERLSVVDEAVEIAGEALKELQIAFDKYGILHQEEEAGESAYNTKKAFVVTGWIRKDDGTRLRELLLAECPDLLIEDIEPDEGEVTPTSVRNPRLLAPFQAVTDMYSTPAYSGIDPTWVMAPFFWCFFGMMVSDAGYGLLLAIGATFFMKKAKLTGMMGQVTAVVAMGGISTVIWGLLYGGIFSIDSVKPILFSPMESPMETLILCLGIGMVHISVGIGTKMYMCIRDKDILGAICDNLFILFMLWGLVMLVLGGTIGTIGGILAITGLVGTFLTAGRDRPGILKKFVGGFSAIYGLTGYLSDVLSYARLFGMGLATGVIGMVFNTIAGMLMGNPIGMVFGVAVLVVGHTFNLAINALGAYVHSCRLQYIEFYSKFFEEGGRAFNPYGYQTKYIQVRNEI
ncbi:V-type ATP synthase subunit I, partial [Eubacteriales bacterium OttesenSCG-928-M02]|nr:V-type ATP synthase subunit I [Eubacteriales bacterium OttesenSCG-928-M02]